jgi:hypothetical protein
MCSLTLFQNFLYKCIGTTLGATSSKEVVRKHLRELLETARYQEEAEREVGSPQCLGLPGSGHLHPLSGGLSACARVYCEICIGMHMCARCTVCNHI